MFYRLKEALKLLPYNENCMSKGSQKAFTAMSEDLESMDDFMKSWGDRMLRVEEDVKALKLDVTELKKGQSEMSGKIDTVIELIKSRLDSPVEKDRIVGAATNLIFSSKKAGYVFLVLIIVIMLAGVSIAYLIENANNVAVIASAIK